MSDISTLDFVKHGGTAECSTTSVSQSSGTSATFRVSCSTDGDIVMRLAAQSVSDGSNLGPATEVTSREVSVRTLPPAAESTQPSPTQTQGTPQATSSAQASPRAPVLLDGELPEVRTSNPLTIVAGQMSENSSQRLESGGQQMVIPTGVSVTIEGKPRSKSATPTISSSGLIQVANGDGLEVTASGLKPGTEVAVWLFSTPRLLGTAFVNADGSLSAVFELGSDVPVGQHTAQVSGLNSKGEIVAFNAGVELIGDRVQMDMATDMSLTSLLLALGASLLVAMFIVVVIMRRRNREATS